MIGKINKDNNIIVVRTIRCLDKQKNVRLIVIFLYKLVCVSHYKPSTDSPEVFRTHTHPDGEMVEPTMTNGANKTTIVLATRPPVCPKTDRIHRWRNRYLDR